MLSIFASHVFSLYANVDLGAQYIRTATIDNVGGATMAQSRSGGSLTANAVSFRTKKPFTGHITNESFEGIQIKYGDAAVRHLHHNPNNGANYLTRLLGRSQSNGYPIPTAATVSELLALQLKELFTAKDLIGIEGATITIPAYYTYRTREALLKSVQISGIPFSGIIDDYVGVIFLYAQKFHERYADKNHSVLFVDVGAAHAAAYRVDFYENSTTIVANQTSYEWSEETGSIAFASAVAEEEGIDLHKAMKRVQRGQIDPDTVDQELEELQRIILLALGNDDVDSVQLFGGASRYSYVEDAIEQVSDCKISRELPVAETTALGGALVTQLLANKVQWPVTVIRSPIYTSRVRCNNVTDNFCKKGEKCTEMAILDNCKCDHLYIEADKAELPEGSGSLLSDYVLTNISDWTTEEISSGIIMLNEPLPIVTSVNWCVTSSFECKPIKFEPKEISKKAFQQSDNFVSDVKRAEIKTKRISTLKGQIRGLVDQLQFSAKESEAEHVKSISENALNVADQSDDLEELDDTVRQLKEYVEDMNKEL